METGPESICWADPVIKYGHQGQLIHVNLLQKSIVPWNMPRPKDQRPHFSSVFFQS